MISIAQSGIDHKSTKLRRATQWLQLDNNLENIEDSAFWFERLMTRLFWEKLCRTPSPTRAHRQWWATCGKVSKIYRVHTVIDLVTSYQSFSEISRIIVCDDSPTSWWSYWKKFPSNHWKNGRVTEQHYLSKPEGGLCIKHNDPLKFSHDNTVWDNPSKFFHHNFRF